MSTADIVVVGAGGTGLCVATELARRGATVTVLDRRPPGTQTSARAAGQSVLVQHDATVADLMRRSVVRFRELAEATSFPVHQVGSLKLAMSDWAAAQLRREIQRAGRVGGMVEEVDLPTVARLAPHVDVSSVVAAWHTPEDLYFQPIELLTALERAATAAGVTVRGDVDVHGFVVSGGRIHAVDTSAGRFSAGQVVLATGAWTAALLGRIGLPVRLVRHQLSIRGPIAGIHSGLPIVRLIDNAVYCRPDSDTTMVFGTYEPRPRTFAPDEIPANIGDLDLDPATVDSALDAVRAVFPSIALAPRRSVRGGVVSMTPDGGYLIDEVPGRAGLFFVTGCNVRGLSVAPALGEDLARWLTEGSRPESLRPYRLSRFTERAADTRLLDDEALAQYEAIYRDPESRRHVRT